MSIKFKQTNDSKTLDFCDTHNVTFNYESYTVYVSNVSVSGSKGSYSFNADSDWDYEGWCDVEFDVERVEDENGDVVIVTNHHFYDKIVNTITSYYEREFYNS